MVFACRLFANFGEFNLVAIIAWDSFNGTTMVVSHGFGIICLARFRLAFTSPGFWVPWADRGGGQLLARYLATSTKRDSRTTVTLISPGYVSCSSNDLAMSRQILAATASSVFLELTMTRNSRPA